MKASLSPARSKKAVDARLHGQADPTAQKLIKEAHLLGEKVARLRFRPPVTHVYNPLIYAWPVHELYLRRFGRTGKRVVFLGMNPGPFGMVQTGVPFGEIAAVRDWMGIRGEISRPPAQHPRRPIQGFDCPRAEISGKRLWGLFAQRFGSADEFFREHFVVNYCPIAFLEKSGSNRTPDKLPAREAKSLREICNAHLQRVLEILRPEWAIGVGGFATERLREVVPENSVRIGTILHPSPACPAANKDWAGKVTAQLVSLGVWS